LIRHGLIVPAGVKTASCAQSPQPPSVAPSHAGCFASRRGHRGVGEGVGAR
jgi:hypothetical protein